MKTRRIDVGERVAFLDETGCPRIGTVKAITAGHADIAVDGWCDRFTKRLTDCMPWGAV